MLRQLPKSTRLQQVIIALLLLVLIVQLYILHVWMGKGAAGGGSELQLSQSLGRRTAPGCVDASAAPSAPSAQAALAVLAKFVNSAKLPKIKIIDTDGPTVVTHGGEGNRTRRNGRMELWRASWLTHSHSVRAQCALVTLSSCAAHTR